MSLIVYNVTNSNVQINYSYLDSEELFGYKVSATYKIDLNDIQFGDVDGVLLSGIDALREAYQKDYVVARIGGDEYNRGKLTSINFEQNTAIGSTAATISIEEYKRLDDYTSKVFSSKIPSPHLLESFDEAFDFSRQGATYAYNRSISLKYAQNAETDFLRHARVFLINFYNFNRPAYGYYEDGISENAKFNNKFNAILTEDIDILGKSVALKESFNSSEIDLSNNVSKQITESVSIDNAGYESKVININLISLRKDKQNTLSNAIKQIIADIISDNQAKYGKPFAIQKSIAKDSDQATLVLSFSTNPDLSQENSATFLCSKSFNGVYNKYSLSCTYKSKGKNTYEREKNCVAFWTSLRSDNINKVVRLFPEATATIYETDRNISFDKNQGTITEVINYIDDEAYDTSSFPAGIFKYKISSNKTNKIKRIEEIRSLINTNSSGNNEIIDKLVVSDYDRLTQATVNIVVSANPRYGVFHGKSFVNSESVNTDAENALNLAVGENAYISSDVTTINLSDYTTNRVINYIIA